MVQPSKISMLTRPFRAPGAALCVVLAAGMGGCEVDSFMDPSQVIRAEHTPTIVPVLDRLAVVEGGDSANPNTFSAITSEDLMPEAESYRIGPGDALVVKVQDFFEASREEIFERLVDDRGFIELPRVGQIFVSGQTGDEATQTVSRALKTRRILTDPIVDVNAVQRRKQTYNIIGGVLNPGTYTIPKPDFRLLEAMGNGGRFSENVQWVYVIRTVSLAPTAGAPVGVDVPQTPVQGTPAAQPQPAAPKRDTVIDLIDTLGKPEEKPAGSPGMMQPGDPVPPAAAPAPAAQTPVIDIDSTVRTEAQPATPPSEWQFVNGQWVRGGGAKGGSSDPAANVLTQRVIQIPMGALLNGAPQYNIIVRPGDTIRVQSLNEGIVYVHGNVNRPGVYNLPQTGRMTLIRAIAAASDLNPIGIPERVDITRYIGPERQATVRVNYRAITEGTQPDIVLRDGDVINVGTNFWAFPLQVLRNGLRTSYGWSFTLDRNFGFDVFGPQQTNSTVF